MTVSEILDELSTYRGYFPREAVRAASAMWTEMAEELLNGLEYTADNVREVAFQDDYMLHLYAMFLCAEKRETRAFSPVLRILSSPDHEAVDRLLGDTLTEDGGSILASLYAGDIAPIQSLIEDRAAYDFARGEGIVALHTLYVHGYLERHTLIEYLRALFEHRLEREPSEVWNTLAATAAELRARELLPHIESAYRDELTEPFFLPEENVKKQLLSNPKENNEGTGRSSRYTLVNDTVEEMQWWAAFDNRTPKAAAPSLPEDPLPTLTGQRGEIFQRQGRKIGRNEPCPCGSGLKYKHCCGR
jgi:hypothetical protein